MRSSCFAVAQSLTSRSSRAFPNFPQGIDQPLTASHGQLRRAALVFSAASIILIGDLAGTVQAQQVWTGGTGNWNTAANWSNNNVPDTFGERAVFQTGTPTSVAFSANTSVGGVTFDAGASAYTISNNGNSISLLSAIVNNSGQTQTFVSTTLGIAVALNADVGAVTLLSTGGGFQFQPGGQAGQARIVYDQSRILVDNRGAGTTLNLGSLEGTGTVQFLSSSQILTVGSLGTSTVYGGNIGASSGAGSAALTKVGAGTFTLTGANAYGGATTITGGTLQVGNGGTSGSIANTSNVVNNGTFAFNRSDNVSFTRVISGTGNLSQAGGGTLVLSGSNTYTGGTTLTAGTVVASNSTPGTSSSIGRGTLTLDGGTFQQMTGNSLTFSNGMMINSTGGTLDATNGTLTWTGSITNGSGTPTAALNIVSSTGGGVVLFNPSTAGSNNYSAPTIIGDGVNSVTLKGGSANAFSANSATTLNTSGTLNVGGFNQSIGSLAGSGTVTNSGGSAGVLTAGGNNTSTTFAGVIQDGASATALTKTGMGTLAFSGANTYTGGTTISAGTLQLGNGGTTGSIVGNVTDNATLAFNRSDAVTFGGVISDTGAVNQIGAGTTTLTASNTYVGPTTVTAGTLAIASSGSITSNVTNNATFGNAGTVTGNLTSTGTASNAGAITGAVVNSGSFTQTAGSVGGGLTNSSTVNANGGAVNGAVANNAGTFNVGGTVTGNGTFGNAAGATLAVGATGAYTLQGLLTNSGTITVAGGGTLTDTAAGITNAAGGSITVAAGGTVRDDLSNASTVINNGAYFANVASNTGTITNNGVWTGNVVSNTGTINNNLTWTGTVTNAGIFNNAAGATVSGLLTNAAGTTTDNGALNGGATVTGGMLTGAGTVGNLTINGGTFAPGNGAPGSSLTVTGNLAFQSGAQYLVQVNPASASFATVTGAATLGGATVNAVYASGSYIARQYTILTAGSVSGMFGALVNSNLPANFTTSLSYAPTHAYLNLTLNFTPPPFGPNFGGGLNANQQNVANALVNFFNTSGGIPLVFGTLTPAGLTQASGESATGSQQTTFDAMNLFMSLLTDPFIDGRGDGAPYGGVGPNGYASTQQPRAARDAFAMFTKAPPTPFEQRWSVWAAGYGGSQSTSGNAALGSNNATSSIAGTAVGADYRFSPDTLAGFAIAGGGTSFSVANAGTGRSDLFQAGVFIRHTAGPAYVSAALAYGWQDITTNRTVTIAGIDQLRAEFNANTYSGRVEGGYRFVTPWAAGFGITPYAAGQFTTFDLPAYAEQAIVGANIFALAYGARDVTDTRSELGLRTDKSYPLPNGIFTLRSRFAWAHDFNPDRNFAATFQTLPGASFVVNGAAQAHDSALTTASAEMKWMNGWSEAATFEGQFSNVTSSYAGKGVVRYTW
jgi:autotransporter-associated beta strand protein